MDNDMSTAFSTADLHDEQPEEVEVVDLQFRHFGGHKCFFGQVETLRVFSDHSAVRDMMKTPGKGRVLVVDGGADLTMGLMGDQIGANAVRNGWAGAVILGAIRDSAALDALPIGIRALGTTARRSSIERAGHAGVTLRIGRVSISPGDWLYADRDAVVIAKRQLGLHEN
jgi:regulator of ribonuclease activity A